jgi:hypothetical protein
MDAMGDEPSEDVRYGSAGEGDAALPDRFADLVGGLTQPEQEEGRTRQSPGALLSGAARVVGRGWRRGRHGTLLGGRWLADQVLATAPRLPIRDQAALRVQFPGKSPEEVADALIEGSARASAAVGAAMGAWSVLPLLPAFPVEVATETLAVVGIEIKLVAELHEVYGMRAPGSVVDRMGAYTAAWAHRRGVSLTLAPAGVALAVTSPLRRLLQRRLAGRATRSAFSLGPFLTGSVAGALANRWETRRLGADVRDDLRRRSPAGTHWPS